MMMPITKQMKKDLKDLGRIDTDLNKLVDMYWQIEFKDWEECGNPEDHIFHAFNNIKNYLIWRKKCNVLDV